VAFHEKKLVPFRTEELSSKVNLVLISGSLLAFSIYILPAISSLKESGSLETAINTINIATPSIPSLASRILMVLTYACGEVI
jgi:hypothetical protein